MNQTWWRSAKEVDPDQSRIYTLPPHGRHLILGPPGSGKTNVMLLRAIYLARGGRPNLKVLSFSRSLVEFLRSGVRENGRLPEDRIDTIAGWQGELYRRLTGRQLVLADGASHDEHRAERNDKIRQIIQRYELQPNYYDSLLLDEAQDLWREEVQIFSALTENLFFVADSRQRIYRANEGIDAVRELRVQEDQLRYHYRIGRKICAAADRILPSAGLGLREFSQYDEVALPSTVRIRAYDSKRSQMKAAVERIETQLRAYPDEWIGIIAPKNAVLDEFEEFVQGSKLEPLLSVHRDGYREFESTKPLVAMTVHSAKGVEFRAVHLLCAEEFGQWYTRELGFTAITRAKTAVDCYFSGAVDGSLEAALCKERVPGAEEVFP